MIIKNVRVPAACVLIGLISLDSMFPAIAQEVYLPDPDLTAAIRDELQKPTGPLTQGDLLNLTNLNGCCRNIKSLEGLEWARNLTVLDLSANGMTSFAFPGGLTNLTSLNLSANGLTNLTLPAGLSVLTSVELGQNQLVNLTLPDDLRALNVLGVEFNQITNLNLPTGLTNLSVLALQHNQLTNLVLPPDTEQLTTVLLGGNPLASFVLSEPMATNALAALVASLQGDGISVFTYPALPRLIRPLALIGSFKFGITGPPGVYSILGSTNLANWSAAGIASNPLGSVNFHDVTANAVPQKFYRALRQLPPTNMVFIPANTFVMGSPINELHRNVNEGPQTTVTLTHDFWIGRFEVTQGEYLDVTGTNPSEFPGDLNRPVSSVSWPEATNYCWLLTQRELAAGRISPGSEYRLPTEAEWECAARAGTTTRFSYGNDPDYASLTNHAWHIMNAGFMVHPVGQKLPNPWGLYDMEGNVWEWCQDWLGDLPGGAVTDPQGPPSNPIGWKVVRGGGYDFGESDCRSARRYFFGNHPALNDSNLGFRVVFATSP